MRKLTNMTLPEIKDEIMAKMSARIRVGWVDFSAFSYDNQVALARAWRVYRRLEGVRVSFDQAMRVG